MAIRQIRTIGDEILTKKCKPVKEMTPCTRQTGLGWLPLRWGF